MKKKSISKLSVKKITLYHLEAQQQDAIMGGATLLCGSRRACSQPVSLCPCISAQACSEYNCTIVA
jgi:hypothetical protein